jgi:hypothetical protein
MHNLHEDCLLPPAFCWTRFGTEAGEEIGSIFQRKEAERLANEGMFIWGVGNSVAPGLIELLGESVEPDILFSPIRSRPRPIDISPAQTVVWSEGETLHGERFEIPDSIRVTSGGATPGAGRHYALVCHSDEPLKPADHGRVNFGSLRNYSSGRSLGASQVTAVVRHDGDDDEPIGAEYIVALRAKLVFPYFLRLDRTYVDDAVRSLAAA